MIECFIPNVGPRRLKRDASRARLGKDHAVCFDCYMVPSMVRARQQCRLVEGGL